MLLEIACMGPVSRPAGLRARGRQGSGGPSRELLDGSRSLFRASRELWEDSRRFGKGSQRKILISMIFIDFFKV